MTFQVVYWVDIFSRRIYRDIILGAAKKHKRNSKYQLWTHENQPKELITKELMQQKLDYIHDNPVRAGIV